MKIEVQVDKDDLKYFNDSIDKLFNDIRYYVSSPSTYDVAVNKIQRGVRENKLAMKNSDGWQKVKDTLVREGRIPYKDPLNVTGQLAGDLYAGLLDTSPKDLEHMGVHISFRDTPRLRPTLKSMYAASKDSRQPIIYEMISSLHVAMKLEKYTGTINGVKYDISEAIYKMYNQDLEKMVYSAVARAFKDNQ